MKSSPFISIAKLRLVGNSGRPLEPQEEAGTAKHQALKVSL